MPELIKTHARTRPYRKDKLINKVYIDLNLELQLTQSDRKHKKEGNSRVFFKKRNLNLIS